MNRSRARELVLLGALALLALLVHWHFRVSGFGEQDATRLALEAIRWHITHAIALANVDYRFQTSPLYVQALKLALDHGLPIRALPALMNGASVVLSSACLIGLYVLFRRLTGPSVAALATVLYALTPCFWLGSIYGMPTLPALTFWVWAAEAFGRALDAPARLSARFSLQLALAAILAAISFALKADLALTGGALLSILIVQRKLRPVLLGCAAFVLAFGAGCSVLLSRLVATGPAPAADPEDPRRVSNFLDHWNARFPFRWAYLVDHKNNAPITHACGTLLFAVIVLALVHGLVSGGKRSRLALALSVWGLPLMLFWGLKEGNSARHNLAAFPPLVLLAASFLCDITAYQLRRTWALVGLLGAMAWLDDSGSGSVTPCVNVVTASREVEAWSQAMHEGYREFMRSPERKKAIIDSGVGLPYAEFEVWAAAKAPHLKPETNDIFDGPELQTRIVAAGRARAGRGPAQALKRDGWAVFSDGSSL